MAKPLGYRKKQTPERERRWRQRMKAKREHSEQEKTGKVYQRRQAARLKYLNEHQ